MKTLKLLTITAVIGVAMSVQAAKITGSIDMSGTAFLNSIYLGSAGKATAFTGVTVGGIPTGTFAGTDGSSVTWNSFGWGFYDNTPVKPLWTFTSGENTYAFELDKVSVAEQNDKFLNLLGNGMLYATGYDATPGAWSFTISNPLGGEHQNFAFTFANSQTSVPDGGVTAMLIGGALAGLAFIRRKLA